jgi:hypothetical protein
MVNQAAAVNWPAIVQLAIPRYSGSKVAKRSHSRGEGRVHMLDRLRHSRQVFKDQYRHDDEPARSIAAEQRSQEIAVDD